MKILFQMIRREKWKLCCIVLVLVIQAMGELKLPEYMSLLIDTGIAANGIEAEAPRYIRTEMLDNCKEMLDESDSQLIAESYKKVTYKDLPKKEQGLFKKKSIIHSREIYRLEQKKANKERLSFIFSNLVIQTSQLDLDNSEYTTKQILINLSKTEYEAIGINQEKFQRAYIKGTGLQMTLVTLVAMLASTITILLAAFISGKIAMNLRADVFRKTMQFTNSQMEKFSASSLITRCTNDIQQVQSVTSLFLRMVLYAPILGVGGLIKVLTIKCSMSWIICIAIVAILIIVSTLFVVTMPKFKILQVLIDDLNRIIRENLSGIMVIRSLHTQKREAERFDGANKELTKNMLFTNRAMGVLMPAMVLIVNVVSVFIVWYGAGMINSHQLQIGEMSAFITYSFQIIYSFLIVSMIAVMLPRAVVSLERIQEVVETEELEKTVDAKDTVEKGFFNDLAFDHVSFRYQNAEVNTLTDINLRIEEGQNVAIIGGTGSGKTTLINLIPRIYDVTEGVIKVNGIDIQNMDKKNLRDLIGFVQQKTSLFSGNLLDNISYGNESVTNEELENAVNIAQMKEVVAGRPKGYKSEVAQSGKNFSGGQKQRISIARALAKNPDILVFDDSFSALDYNTEAKLRGMLKEKLEGKTIITVGQRIYTVMSADYIIVLDEGRIVGIGSHEELLKTCKVYKQIVLSQFSEEELKKYNLKLEGGYVSE